MTDTHWTILLKMQGSKTFLGAIAVFLSLWLVSPHAAAQDPTPPSPVSSEKAPAATPLPNLAELYPMASRLAERQAKMEKELAEITKSLAIDQKLTQSRERLDSLTKRLQTLRDTSKYNYDQLADLRNTARSEMNFVNQDLGKAISEALARLDGLQKEWKSEREKWKKWEEDLPAEVPREAVQPSFQEAFQAIDHSLRILPENVKPVLEAQRRIGEVQASLQNITAEADSLLQAARGELFRKSNSSMLSPAYYHEFIQVRILEEVKTAFLSKPPLGLDFFAANSWIIVLQVVVFLIIVVIIHRKGKAIQKSERWRFVWERPYATALFFSVSAFSPFYGEAPAGWRLVLWTAAGVAAVRLVFSFVRERWHKRLLFLLASLFLLSHFFKTFGLPAPVFRLYVAIVATLGTALCYRRASIQARAGDSPVLIGALKMGGLLFASILIAQVGGYGNLAVHLLEASIQSIFLILLVWMFAHLLKGGMEFLLGENSPLQGIQFIRWHAQAMNRHAGIIINVAAAILSLALVLEALRVYDTPLDAMAGVFSLGFSIGEQRYTFGLLIVALLILYATFIISWALQDFLTEEIYPRSHMEYGVQVSINRLIHYALILLGFLVAISQLGFNVRNITILAGAFGIGIGFGLQNIVNNFVSGLILLFERPVKVGDVVILDGEWAVIKKLGLRATIVQTFGRSDIIVPNSEFISTKVVNLTLSDRLSRIKIPVGVAYGSDVQLVMRILREVASNCKEVSPEPNPQVLFTGFGDSSLNFEIRVWVEVDKYFAVISAIHQMIDARFREEGVEIPFPQRDLHLRSIDEKAGQALRPRKTPEDPRPS